MTGTIPVPMFRSGNNSSIYGCVSIRILNNLHATNKNLFAKSKDLYLSSPTWKYSCKLQYYKIQRKCSCMSFHHSQTVCNSFIFYKSSSQNQSHWKQASNYSKHISIWMLNCTHVIPKALENRGTVKAMVNEI